MKKTITTIGMAMLVCVTAIVFNGCKGKDGAPGAQGPAGPQGNANVDYMVFQVSASNWAYSSPSYFVNLIDPMVTADILNTGAVLVYADDGVTVTQLPLTIYPSSTYSETWTPYESINNVQVQVTDSDLTAPNNPGSILFKVVVMASKSLLQNPHINFKSFESVKAAFHLK